MKITYGICRIAATRNYVTLASERISLDYHDVAETSSYAYGGISFSVDYINGGRANFVLKLHDKLKPWFSISATAVKLEHRFMTDIRTVIWLSCGA